MSVAANKKINPVLAAYLGALAAHPLRTKALTTSALQFTQEVLASHLANVPAQRVSKDASILSHILARAKVNQKAIYMALYGFFVSAPVSHVLVGATQKAFTGKTGLAAKIGQLLAANLVVAPIQILVYLTFTSVINGARSVNEVSRVVKGGFLQVLRVTWMTLPLTVVVAQTYLAPELWVPFMNAVQFVTGTYFNTKLKKINARLLEKKAKKDRDVDDAE
ncbi:hypothetical protein B0H21DRAFT_776701 [Amylocystis lapponica]|nr:hypothetical protein B0H21DRAFT_776701 [Amylocystis lapponica]